MEAGWIRMRGRRRTPGRPVTYGTTEAFLDHFGLESLADLPGLEELKGAGLLSNRLPSNFQVPLPFDGALREDEDPLDPEDLAEDDEPEEMQDEPEPPPPEPEAASPEAEGEREQ
jgi:segregation and condensation protein B